MNFAFEPELLMLRDSVRRFVQEELRLCRNSGAEAANGR